MKNIKDYVLYAVLFILIIFFVLYIFCDSFRQLLSSLKIDPSFLVAFVTVITLIISIIGNRKERKYHFNLNLKNSIEDKTTLVIGKLFAVMNNAEIYFRTIQNIQKAMNESKKFIDINDITSFKDSFNNNIEILGAYITIYFHPYISEDWGKMNEKINRIASSCSTLLLNYNENYNLIGTENFENEVLSRVNEIKEEAENLNSEIYNLTESMKNKLLDIVVKNDENLKKKYLN